ncbi:MAG: Outer rane efflux protein [Pedosphaera sp.]|nr:Outer rane efflux protein [Pedosphaera sp.]
MVKSLKAFQKCALTLSVLGASLASIAQAQVTNKHVEATQVFSLAEIKRVAVERNWDLLAAKSGIDTATAQQIVAREFPNPTASVFTSKFNTDANPNSTVQGNSFWHRSYDTIFAVSQLVEIGGKRSSRQAAAKAGGAGARARFYDARRLLDQGVTKAYVNVLLTENQAQILKHSAQSLRREADIAGTRFRAGDISDSDKKRIEINAERFDLDAKTAEVAAASSRIAVEVLMGITHPHGDWRPAESLDQLAGAAREHAIVKPDAARPDLLAAEADLRRARADVRLQKSMRIPDPTLSLQYEHQPPDQPNTIGFGISFPLPLWNLNKGAIKAAQAEQELASIQIEKIQAQIFSEIITAEHAYHDADERRQRYENQIRPKSEQVRQAFRFSYEKGGAALVDLLTAERDDNDVRLATVQAMADSANAAADLAAARNVLAESELTSRK